MAYLMVITMLGTSRIKSRKRTSSERPRKAPRLTQPLSHTPSVAVLLIRTLSLRYPAVMLSVSCLEPRLAAMQEQFSKMGRYEEYLFTIQ